MLEVTYLSVWNKLVTSRGRIESGEWLREQLSKYPLIPDLNVDHPFTPLLREVFVAGSGARARPSGVIADDFQHATTLSAYDSPYY